MRHIIYVRTYGEELTSVVPVKTQKVSGERTSKRASKQASTRPQNFSMSKADFDFCNDAQKSEYRGVSININTGKKIAGEHF